ncbi:MAG: hypothetical protein AAGI15_02070 [Pseudomonadota bacterium]
MADRIADGIANGKYQGATDAEGEYGGFETLGALPDLNRMPAINEGHNQCLPAMVGRALGYLGNRNDPNGTRDYSAQNFADELLRELGGWVDHDARNKRPQPQRPAGGTVTPGLDLNLCDGPIEADIDGDAQATDGGSGPGGGPAGGGQSGEATASGAATVTIDPPAFGGLTGYFAGRLISAKLEKLKTMPPPWNKVRTRVLKNPEQSFGGESLPPFGEVMNALAKLLNEGVAVEMHLQGGAGLTTGRHATVLAKIVRFASTGHYGLVFAEDGQQGDNKSNNTLKGPYIFHKDTGECLNSPGMQILEIVRESWG